MSSCFRRPLWFWTLRSRARALRSGMLFSFSSERFIPLVVLPPVVAVVPSAFWGVGLDWPRSPRRALIQRLRVCDGEASLLGLGLWRRLWFSLRLYSGVE